MLCERMDFKNKSPQEARKRAVGTSQGGIFPEEVGEWPWLVAGGWPGGWGWVDTGESEGHRGNRAECGWTEGVAWRSWVMSRTLIFLCEGEEPVEFSGKCCDLIYARNTAPSRCCVESRCLGQGKKRDPQPGAAVLLSAITARQGGGQPWVPGNFERRSRSPVLTDWMSVVQQEEGKKAGSPSWIATIELICTQALHLFYLKTKDPNYDSDASDVSSPLSVTVSCS